jgi:hypothetical protein
MTLPAVARPAPAHPLRRTWFVAAGAALGTLLGTAQAVVLRRVLPALRNRAGTPSSGS